MLAVENRKPLVAAGILEVLDTRRSAARGEYLRPVVERARKGVSAAQQQAAGEAAVQRELPAVVRRVAPVRAREDSSSRRIDADTVYGVVELVIAEQSHACRADVCGGHEQVARKLALDVRVPLVRDRADNIRNYRGHAQSRIRRRRSNCGDQAARLCQTAAARGGDDRSARDVRSRGCRVDQDVVKQAIIEYPVAAADDGLVSAEETW